MTRYSSSKHIMYSAPPAPEENDSEAEAETAVDDDANPTVAADAEGKAVTADDD